MAPFLTSLAVALLLTPVVRAWARRAGLVAHPKGDRWHRSPTALFGGIGIFGGFAAALAFLPWGGGPDALRLAAALVAPGVVMFATGLADDKLTLSPAAKLTAQGVAAALLVGLGVVYPATPWTVVNLLFTLFWFVGITNAVNLTDNMDGSAAGTTAVAAGWLAALFAMEGAMLPAAVALALCGACLGFLVFNFNPASIFMGDSGSLLLGAVLAGLGAAYPAVSGAPPLAAATVPVLILILPILDTTLVTVTRIVSGRPVSQGGRDHLTHRLVSLGLGERRVVLTMYVAGMAAGTLALLLHDARGALGQWVGALILLGALVGVAYLAGMQRGGERAASPHGRILSELVYRRRVLAVALDAIAFALAWGGAYLLRFDAPLPPAQQALLERTLPLAVVGKLSAFALLGVYRTAWRRPGVADVHRILKATVAGALASGTAVFLLFRAEDLSRTVVVIDVLLVACLATGFRMVFRSLERLRLRLTESGEPTLVYGAGAGGDLAVLAIAHAPDLGLRPVGFLDDDDRLVDTLVHGLPVLGRGADLPVLAPRHGVTRVLVGTRKLPPEALAALSSHCEALGCRLLELDVGVRPLEPAPREVRPMAAAPEAVPVPADVS